MYSKIRILYVNMNHDVLIALFILPLANYLISALLIYLLLHYFWQFTVRIVFYLCSLFYIFCVVFLLVNFVAQ